jgi:drug/metabolite transporter (DMT)-like permease
MNSKTFSLVSSIVVTLMLVIGVILCWGAMQTVVDPITKQGVGDLSSVDNSVSFSLFLFYGAMILVLAFTIWGIIINPKRFIPSAIGVGVMLLIFLYCYATADTTATGELAKLPGATEFWLKWSDIGVIMTYILFAIAVILLVVQLFRNLFSFFAK